MFLTTLFNNLSYFPGFGDSQCTLDISEICLEYISNQVSILERSDVALLTSWKCISGYCNMFGIQMSVPKSASWKAQDGATTSWTCISPKTIFYNFKICVWNVWEPWAKWYIGECVYTHCWFYTKLWTGLSYWHIKARHIDMHAIIERSGITAAIRNDLWRSPTAQLFLSRTKSGHINITQDKPNPPSYIANVGFYL
jgi:hypothetical protein